MTATIDGRNVPGLHDRSTPYRAAVGGFSYTLTVREPTSSIAATRWARDTSLVCTYALNQWALAIPFESHPH